MTYRIDGQAVKKINVDGQEVVDLDVDGNRIWPDFRGRITAGKYVFDIDTRIGYSLDRFDGGIGSKSGPDMNLFGCPLEDIVWWNGNGDNSFKGIEVRGETSNPDDVTIDAWPPVPDEGENPNTVTVTDIFTWFVMDTDQGREFWHITDLQISAFDPSSATGVSLSSYAPSSSFPNGARTITFAHFTGSSKKFSNGVSYDWRLIV